MNATDPDYSESSATAVVTVPGPSGAPAPMPDSYQTVGGSVLTVPAPGVLDNDTDPDGDLLMAALGSGPMSGSLTIDADGSFAYTPSADFVGIDSFTYTATDGTFTSEPTTVSITVTEPIPAGQLRK